MWRMLQAVCELGRETINTAVYVQMDASECHVITDSLAAYTLTGEPRTASSRAVKILRLAAFAPQLPTSVDFNLRVYFVEDTQDALEVSRTLSVYFYQWNLPCFISQTIYKKKKQQKKARSYSDWDILDAFNS